MFAPLPSPAEMSGWDRAAIDLGLPELLLMENASREALHVLSAETGQMPGKRVLLFMGGGNNGGDAACLARHLHDGGAEVLVLHTRPLGAYRGVTGQHVRLARRCGVAFAPAAGWPEKYRNTPWDVYADASVCERGGPDIVVDGILGTGFSGSLRPLELGLVARINALAQRAFIFSLDIPSGLSGLTGRPCPVAVRAHATVTFEAAKPGLVLPEGASRFLSDDHESHCRSFSGSRSGVAQGDRRGHFDRGRFGRAYGRAASGRPGRLACRRRADQRHRSARLVPGHQGGLPGHHDPCPRPCGERAVEPGIA